MACTTFHVLAIMGCLAAFAGSSCGAPLLQSGVVEQRAASPTQDLHLPANGTEETDVLVQVWLPETTHVAPSADFIAAVVRDRRANYETNKWSASECEQRQEVGQCSSSRRTRKNCCTTCQCRKREPNNTGRARRQGSAQEDLLNDGLECAPPKPDDPAYSWNVRTTRVEKLFPAINWDAPLQCPALLPLCSWNSDVATNCQTTCVGTHVELPAAEVPSNTECSLRAGSFLNEEECLAYRQTHEIAGSVANFAMDFDQLPHGCQMFYPNNAAYTIYQRVIFNRNSAFAGHNTIGSSQSNRKLYAASESKRICHPTPPQTKQTDRWCNNDKIPVPLPVTLVGRGQHVVKAFRDGTMAEAQDRGDLQPATASYCMLICKDVLGCAQIGFRRHDNHCEFWASGSCKVPHYQRGHDIYQVKPADFYTANCVLAWFGSSNSNPRQQTCAFGYDRCGFTSEGCPWLQQKTKCCLTTGHTNNWR